MVESNEVFWLGGITFGCGDEGAEFDSADCSSCSIKALTSTCLSGEPCRGWIVRSPKFIGLGVDDEKGAVGLGKDESAVWLDC